MPGARTALFSRLQPGGMFSIQDQSETTGDIWFVHSGTGTDGAGFGQNPDSPCATLDYAMGLATASKGDRIYLMPGHAETITTNTGCLFDKIGVQVIGLGTGSLRPTFTLGAAAGSIVITAANCVLQNVIIVNNFLDIVSSITVGADADGLTLKDVEIRDTSVILGALVEITFAAGCSDVTIDGLRVEGLALTAIATDCILAAGAMDRLKFVNSYMYGKWSHATVSIAGAKSTGVILDNIHFVNIHATTGVGINLEATTTGTCNNVVGTILTDAVKSVVGAAMAMGPVVMYSNDITKYAGLFAVTIDA